MHLRIESGVRTVCLTDEEFHAVYSAFSRMQELIPDDDKFVIEEDIVILRSEEVLAESLVALAMHDSRKTGEET